MIEGKNTLAGEACEERSERHVGINSAINNIDSVVEHLGNLVDKIKCQQSPCAEDCAKSQDPSLEDVLLSAEENIRSQIDLMHKRINEIENLIF